MVGGIARLRGIQVVLVILICIAGLLGLAVLICLISDRATALISRLRNPPDKIAAQRLQFERRLLAPDWEFYREHLGRPVPEALKHAFSTAALVLSPHNFSDFYVAFSPIDKAALDETWVLPGVVAFADSDGDPIFLKPGATSPDSVHIAFHDGGGTEELAPNVEAFLAGLRASDDRRAAQRPRP